MTVDERVAVVPALKPELASMNAGSINWGLFPIAANPKMEWRFDGKTNFTSNNQAIFKNTFGDMMDMYQNLKPLEQFLKLNVMMLVTFICKVATR
jgi:uncharacterized protein (DUF849 family)